MPKLKSKGLVLTHDNYYTAENVCISNSKISDFLLSKEYFYRRHITHELTSDDTVPIKIGKMVDAIVCGNPVPYEVKVLKRDNPELFERQKEMPDTAFVTESQWNEAQGRAQAITKEPFYQWYLENKAEFQVIMQGALIVGDDNPKDIPICGQADVITVVGDTVYIDDFKSVSPMKIKTPQHWYWTCEDMGYFRQMGNYAWMTAMKHPGKKVVCRHVCVTKLRDEVWRVYLFNIPHERVAQGFKEFEKGLELLVATTNFIDEPITWDQAYDLTPGKQEMLIVEEGEL